MHHNVVFVVFAALSISMYCNGQSVHYGYPSSPEVVNHQQIYNDAALSKELFAMPISPPVSLLRPLITSNRTLNSGGAVNPYPKSIAALQLPIITQFEKQTQRILADIKDGLRYVLQTRNEWTLALHGTGTLAITTVLDNLIEPGDKIVVGLYDQYGIVASNISEKFGANVVRLEKPWGSRLSLQEIETALIIHRPKILYLVNGASSTGVLQPLDGVGDLCHKYGCLSVADLVGTVGQMPINMDKNKIDVVLMNSHKALGVIVGLAPVSLSKRAVEKVLNRRTPTFLYNSDLLKESKAWLIGPEFTLDSNPLSVMHQVIFHSISLPLLYSLREGLASIAEEGIENVWARHDITRKYFHERAKEIGLEFFVPREQDRLVGIHTFKLPPGKDSFKIEAFIINKYHMEVSPGLGPTRGKIIRVGLFGLNANVNNAANVITVLQDALNSPLTNV